MSADVFDWLDSLGLFTIELGLDRTRELCRRLGEPQESFRSALVAGTNGKGSVAAMIAGALGAAGERVALYTSPHLERLEERFVIGGEEVRRERLAAALSRVRDAAAELPERATYFEVTTAAGFLLFAEAGCERAVLEVGLGGRLDATNVAEPEISVVTRIGLDHTAYLGETLAAVAREKAGILRAGRPAVLAPQEPEAMAALLEEAERVGAEAVRVDPEAPLPCEPAMEGEHQRENARVAAAALRRLGVAGEHVRAGIGGTTLPGRLQRIPGDPPVLLDGAHNALSARALAAYLEELAEPPWLLFSCMRDKDARALLGPLLPRVRGAVLTAVDDPRALPPGALLDLARELRSELPSEAVAGVGPALETARSAARSAGAVLLVAGSLYLLGEVLPLARRG